MKEYKIELQDTGKKIIIYYHDGVEELREHYANKDGTIIGEIRNGYIEKKNIAARVVGLVTEPVVERTVVVEGKEYKLVENKLSLWRRFLNNFK